MARAARVARAVAALVLCAAAGAAHADARDDRVADFDAMRHAIESRYAYPEALEAWRAGWPRWRRRARDAADDDAFVAALEGALELLHDDHVALSRRTHRSPRRVPQETDLWARFVDRRARIEDVRSGSDADARGVQPGQIVARVQDVDIARAVDARAGAAATPAQRDRALRHLLAGPRRGAFTLELEPGPRRVTLERLAPQADPAGLARRIGESRDVAYLRLRFTSAPAASRQVDEAFAALIGTRAFILDLRDNAGPATRADMQAVLSRFARAPGVWQVRVARDGRRQQDRVSPHAAASSLPLVVLVDRWTRGEAESLAVGLRAVAGATLLGTPMAGLQGVQGTAALTHSGITLRFPVERALAPDGSPREAARPDVDVDLTVPSAGPGDPILYQALKRLERR
jgi:carboxyl-terminal processing protease